MRNKLIILLLVIFSSCSNKKDGYFKHEVINTSFVVTDVTRAKYSKVNGFINHNNIIVPVDNGNTGYYYKDYNLYIGQEIKTSIDIYYYPSNSGYKLVFGDIHVDEYIKNK